MTNYKIKLFAILMFPIVIQSAAITDWNQKLLEAAQIGNLVQVKEALSNGANIDARDEVFGWTPLHYAASDGSSEVVNALILAKATIDARTIGARNNDQWTPLHWASRNGKTEVINALILAKATIDARSTEQYTSLHLAAENACFGVIKTLLDVGANATLLDKDNKTVFHLIAKSYMQQNKKDLLEKLIKDRQAYQEFMLKEVPKLFIAQYDQLKIPVPIAKLITQYAFGICETEKNNKGDNHDKL